ncbi:MAG: SWFGD domain-containing protein [Sphingomonas taxi]|uniref:SWFGD domain-containing protein n=1 Tax=Sphingomonas taxi TaxID=1549858 RepID=A0A2W5RHS5_9SPHN|nr:MAG: SWFGD domain-containing protein [Sphingomonas taxi]
MGYERYPRGTNPQGDYYGRSETQDYGRDYGSGRSGSYSSARDYQASGAFDRDDDRGGYRGSDRQPYGQRDYGYGDYPRGRDDDGYQGSYRGQRDDDRDQGRYGAGRGGSSDGRYGAQPYGQSRYGQSQYGQSSYGQSRYGQGGGEYHGSYASDGRRFNDVGQRRHADDDDYGRREHGRHRDRGAGYGRQPQGYDYDERGFFARAGDEVRSWFGDEEAERRREADSRYDDRYYAQQGRHDRDGDYHSWRSGQIAALDRDYDEYRQENRSRFENEFSSWRSERQTQRSSLEKVKEHDEVLGSDGTHVGTVDKVRGDRILLTKNDADAGGQHHSIPSRWIKSVEDKKVTLSKTADEAKQHWRTEEQNQAMFGYGDRGSGSEQNRTTGSAAGAGDTGKGDRDTNLNRSFSGTY